jgi:PAS domain S-box-containing protein
MSKMQEKRAQFLKQAQFLDLAHEAIFVRDRNDGVTFWNSAAEQRYGWSRGEALGKQTHSLLHTKQVLHNVLSNAIKFNHDGGKVEIRVVRREDDWLELKVMDTGIGIKAEDLSRLFREFVQIDSGASRQYEGTGLGLALTRKIVELQGGRIGVESEVGKGSCFTVVLPLIMAEVSPLNDTNTAPNFDT